MEGDRGPYRPPIDIDDNVYLFHDFLEWTRNSYDALEVNLQAIREIEGVRLVESHGIEFLVHDHHQIALCCNLAFHVGMFCEIH